MAQENNKMCDYKTGSFSFMLKRARSHIKNSSADHELDVMTSCEPCLAVSAVLSYCESITVFDAVVRIVRLKQ